MKKWLVLLTMTIIATSMFAVATIKVAVLPLKRLDSPSKYIQKFLTIRDLQRTFDTNKKFTLLDMKATAEVFKDSGIEDIDEMEKEDMADIGRELNADVVILGSISAINDMTFSIQFRFYSMRTDNIVSQRIDVVKDKFKRWAVLDTDFMGKLSGFVNDELDKMNTLAIQDYQAENYTQAKKGFNDVLNYNPEDKQAYYYLGMIAYNQKDYPEAINNLNKALSDTLSIKDINTLQGLVNVYRDMKNSPMTLSTMVKLAQVQEDEELWLNVANLYAENKQNDKAKEALQKALQINPDYNNAKYRLAFLLYDMGEYSDAIPYLELAADANPDNDLIARRLATAYQKSGRIDEAITRLENSIAANPNNSLPYLSLVGLYRTAATDASEQNNQTLVNQYNQKALDTLNKLKVLDPENALLYLRYADVFLATNKLADSETAANTAVAKDATLYQPYVILGTINQRRGTDKYNQFIDLDKQFQKAYGRTASRLAKERDAARLAANSYFRKADEQFRAAKMRTNEPEVISEMDSKINLMAQLIEQTGKSY